MQRHDEGIWKLSTVGLQRTLEGRQAFIFLGKVDNKLCEGLVPNAHMILELCANLRTEGRASRASEVHAGMSAHKSSRTWSTSSPWAAFRGMGLCMQRCAQMAVLPRQEHVEGGTRAAPVNARE